jgi:predicted dehydrogenase
VVAVAEPREWFRNEAARRHTIPVENVFHDWRDLLAEPRLADAVVIATQDADHCAPVLAACAKGYDILLEKPMAPTEAACREIVAAVKKRGVLLAVCHVLRYTPYFRKLRSIVQSGVLGQIATIRHFEQVGFWHQAHSFVRGNWRNESLSSPMILAKSCHDMDILLYILGKPCTHLSSFGSLTHFHAANAPDGAAKRCIDCSVECPYSAKDFYLGKLAEGKLDWPLNIITQDLSESGVRHALREGPYGRCVYHCDNDVVDHQVVSMQFADGVSASFTMTAFTAEENRRTDIFASHGEVRGDGQQIVLKLFSGAEEIFDYSDASHGADSGHMGGDFGIMDDFIAAIRSRSEMESSADISLMSHLMAFAAERSRKNNGAHERIEIA